MKRLLPILFLILLALPCQAQDKLARMAPAIGVMGGGAAAAGCGATSEPAGDLVSDGYETPGCESACTEVEGDGVDPAYTLSSLSGGIGATQNCNYGLQVVSTGQAGYAYHHLASGVPEFWREFSFYIDSEGLAGGTNVVVACASSDTACSSNVMVMLRISQPGAPEAFQVYASASGNSTARNVNLDTWYYVRIHAFDIGDCTDVDNPYVGCTGSATGNGQIWVGTTYSGTDIANGDTFAGTNVTTDPDEFGLGVYSASRTLTIVFGYDAVDDDGTL